MQTRLKDLPNPLRLGRQQSECPIPSHFAAKSLSGEAAARTPFYLFTRSRHLKKPPILASWVQRLPISWFLFAPPASGRIKRAMVTDSPPRKKNRQLFTESDGLSTLRLPQDDRLQRIAKGIEAAMKTGRTEEVLRVSAEFIDTAADFYQVKHCHIRVLAARPLRASPVMRLGETREPAPEWARREARVRAMTDACTCETL